MMQRPASVLLIALVVIASGARAASAQAWVGETGSLDVSLDYNLGISSKVKGDEETFDDSGVTTHQLTLGAEYVPIRALAVTVALPFGMFKYTGSKTLYPHAGGGSYDDGSLHSTLTDLRFGVRYQLLDDPIALSPHLGVSIPLADYETVGNAVAGRHLKALHAGLGIGTIIGLATYVHLLYEFSLVEKYDRTPETETHSQNRSDIAFTLGHKLLDQKLDIHIDANYRKSHGGVNFSEFPALSPAEAMYHDAILAEDILLAGGGIGYQLTDKLVLSLSARLFVTGANTQNASVFALGLAWSPL